MKKLILSLLFAIIMMIAVGCANTVTTMNAQELQSTQDELYTIIIEPQFGLIGSFR